MGRKYLFEYKYINDDLEKDSIKIPIHKLKWGGIKHGTIVFYNNNCLISIDAEYPKKSNKKGLEIDYFYRRKSKFDKSNIWYFRECKFDNIEKLGTPLTKYYIDNPIFKILFSNIPKNGWKEIWKEYLRVRNSRMVEQLLFWKINN